MNEFIRLDIDYTDVCVKLEPARLKKQELSMLISLPVYINPLTCNAVDQATQKPLAEQFGVVKSVTKDGEIIVKLPEIGRNLPFSSSEVVILKHHAALHPDKQKIIGRYFNIYE